MDFLTNWIFWASLVAIFIVMAIIGYLAEGKGEKKKEVKPAKPAPAPAENKPINEVIANEQAAPNEWSGEIKAVDPTHEHDYEVEDWSAMPDDIPSAPEKAPSKETPSSILLREEASNVTSPEINKSPSDIETMLEMNAPETSISEAEAQIQENIEPAETEVAAQAADSTMPETPSVFEEAMEPDPSVSEVETDAGEEEVWK